MKSFSLTLNDSRADGCIQILGFVCSLSYDFVSDKAVVGYGAFHTSPPTKFSSICVYHANTHK